MRPTRRLSPHSCPTLTTGTVVGVWLESKLRSLQEIGEGGFEALDACLELGNTIGQT